MLYIIVIFLIWNEDDIKKKTCQTVWCIQKFFLIENKKIREFIFRFVSQYLIISEFIKNINYYSKKIRCKLEKKLQNTKKIRYNLEKKRKKG